MKIVFIDFDMGNLGSAWRAFGEFGPEKNGRPRMQMIRNFLAA